MPTPTFITGFEHGVLITGATPVPNDRIWHSVLGTLAVETSIVRSGARSLRSSPAGDRSYVSRIVAGDTVMVASFYVYFDSLPANNAHVAAFTTSGSWAFISFRASDNTLGMTTNSGLSNFEAGPVISAGQWYRVDFRADVSANPWLLDMQVDGTPLTQLSSSITATTLTNWRVGGNVDTSQTPTYTIYIDDLVLSATSGDYPLGDHEVLAIRPNADGDHGFPESSGRFGYDDAGADILGSATDVWTYLDDPEIETIGATDSIRQKVAHATSYIELHLGVSPRPGVDAWGLIVMSAHDALATGANKNWMKFNDGGTIEDVYSNGATGADFSNTSVTFNASIKAVPPSGGVWTQAKIDALRLRWGYSTDVVGVPVIHGVIVEIAFPVTAAPPSFQAAWAGGSHLAGSLVA